MSDETAPIQTSETTATNDADVSALNAAVEDNAAVDATTDTENTEVATDDATALNAGGDDGADETVEAKAEVPDKYELTMPDGITLDAALLDEATPVLKELGLSQDQANKLVPLVAKISQAQQDAIFKQVRADRKAWLDEAKADPEVGGPNWDKTIVSAAAALDKLGFPKGSEFRNLLDESGLGNNLAMIRAWKRVNDAIGEDSNFVRGDVGKPAPKDVAERWYSKEGAE